MRPNNLPKQLLKTLFDSPVAYSHSKSKQKLIDALELRQLTKADVSVLNNIVLAVEAAKKSSIPGYTIVVFYTFKPTANSSDTKETVDVVLNSDVWVFMTASGNGDIAIDIRTVQKKWQGYSEITKKKLQFVDAALRLYVEAYTPVQTIETEINKKRLQNNRDGWVHVKINGFDKEFIIPQDSDPAVVKQVVYQTLRYDLDMGDVEYDQFTYEMDVCSKFKNVQPIGVLITLPLDIIFTGVFALYDIGEGLKAQFDAIWPTILESLSKDEGGVRDKVFSILFRSKLNVKRKWLQIYKKYDEETAKKMILQELIQDIKEEQDENPDKLLEQIQSYTINDLKILDKRVLLDLMTFNGILTEQQKKLVYSYAIVTREEVKEHLDKVSEEDDEQYQSLLLGLSKRYANIVQSIDSSLEYSQHYYDSIGFPPAAALVAVGPLALKVGGVTIGWPFVIIGAGVALTSLSVSAAILGGALAATAPITKYLLDTWKEGEGGWGDNLRRKGRAVKLFVKKQYLKQIRRMSDEEIEELFKKDLEETLAELTPTEALRRVHAMSKKDLERIPKVMLDSLIKNSMLTIEQFALLKNDIDISKEDLKGTIYNPNFVLFMQNISQSQILSLDQLTIERFLRARVFTDSQVKWMLDQDIIKKRQLRGTPYDLGDIKDSPDYNQTQDVLFKNFDK